MNFLLGIMLRNLLLNILFVVNFFLFNASAQFGVSNKKNAGSFQELHELAKEQMEDENWVDDLDAVNEDSLQKIIKDALNDPHVLNTMGQINFGMDSVIDELGNMSTSDLKRHFVDGINHLTSPEMIDTIMGNKDEVLSSLKEQGLISAEQIDVYKNDSSKFEAEMTEAILQMQTFFDSPETLQAATSVVEGLSKIIKNPDDALKRFAETFSETLNNDDKIEDARLQLLNDPGKIGNSVLASLFENEKMKKILKNPNEWRKQVRKGQGLLLGDEEAVVSIGDL